MASSNAATEPHWHFFQFGLIVTGKGEEAFLPSLFRSLAATGKCHFQVIRRIGQRSPIISKRRKLRMTGTGKTIPDRDQSEIGIPARRFLTEDSRFVILVDDLEQDRANEIKGVFERYRLAFDTILGAKKHRASVHFFVPMLEAYYFADARAINAVLGTKLDDYEGDVEAIPHPKSELKELASGFDEVEHGRQIVARLDVPHVLSNPEVCASLRTLFGWGSAAIGERPGDQYQLVDGHYNEVTRPQIDTLSLKEGESQ
jgi:hypothetical protein